MIEFANGTAETKWGGVRASLGHPAPFGLEYLAIGNEEVGQAFFERYAIIHDAIKAKYPEIKIINSAGPFAAGKEYERGWRSARAHGSDLVDEHYYNAPEWFLANQHRYDHFDPAGPKVFVGEYASKENKWYNAVVEASYMLGLERNADKVGLACYAPLFCNADLVNWQPDLIWFNQKEAYGSPSYYVQKLFMTRQGTCNVTYTMDRLPAPERQGTDYLPGKIIVEGDNADVTVSDVVIINRQTGETISGGEARVSGKSRIAVASLDSHDYVIRFKATKTGGNRQKGFHMLFGYQDAENYFAWVLGGWGNEDSSIRAITNGNQSDLTQTAWHMTANQVYDCELHVQGRSITSFIDGRQVNSIEWQQTVIESTYSNAVYDEERNAYIIKLVNVRETPLAVDLNLQVQEDSAAVTELSGDREAVHSFEKPVQIKQRDYSLKLENGRASVTLPAYSLVFVEVHI